MAGRDGEWQRAAKSGIRKHRGTRLAWYAAHHGECNVAVMMGGAGRYYALGFVREFTSRRSKMIYSRDPPMARNNIQSFYSNASRKVCAGKGIDHHIRSAWAKGPSFGAILGGQVEPVQGNLRYVHYYSAGSPRFTTPSH